MRARFTACRNIAYLRQEYERALSLAQRSLTLTTNPEMRCRVWAAIGYSLIELAQVDLARRVFLMIRSSPSHKSLQWGCVYALLEIHSYQGDLRAVSTYALQLLASASTPYQQAHACALLGQCYDRLGEAEIGREYSERAIALAWEHGISQLAMETSAALPSADRGKNARVAHQSLQSVTRYLETAESALHA